MNDRNLPEYHELFQKMDGDVILKVRFAGRNDIRRSFPSKPICWKDVAALFGGLAGAPYTRMNFDEWPFTVKKIEIEPGKNQVTLVIL